MMTTILNRRLPLRTRQLRVRIAELISQASASHVGSCFSMIELLDAVYQNVDVDKIKQGKDDRDRVIISKGHSAVAVYAVLTEYGLMDRSTLESYGQSGSLLSGHVSHFVPFIEHSTGALGHGLSVAVGICIGMKSIRLNSVKCYVLVGDAELQEGSNWEALMLAGQLRLSNLCLLVDKNELGGVGNTALVCSVDPLKARLESFGFKILEVDGHDQPAVLEAIATFKSADKPVAVIGSTVKGRGASFMEGQNVWHNRPPNKEDCERIRLELLGETHI